MLRDSLGCLVFEKLNVFELIIHEISVENGVKTHWECIYEHVKVFTNSGEPLVAYNYCGYGRVVCYVSSAETDDTVTILKAKHAIVKDKVKKLMEGFNAFQNCLGFCVLDGIFWINLTPENVKQILSGDNYVETDDLDQNYLAVYYQNDDPVHISKYVFENNEFHHKIGCNSHCVKGSVDISEVYNYNIVKRYVQLI